MAKSPFSSVDEYIASFEGEVRARLERMCAVIRETVPEAEERLSWGTPTYYLNGFLVEFAAAKKHIGFYSSPETIAAFAGELTEYETEPSAAGEAGGAHDGASGGVEPQSLTDGRSM